MKLCCYASLPSDTTATTTGTLAVSVILAVIAVFAFSNTDFVLECEAHGYLFEPVSRNYWSNVNGKDYGLESGVPIPREYCYHCLNTNTGVCGTSEQGVNYDEWLDSLNEPMPWISTATYNVGDIITIGTKLTAHHLGHMELRGCPVEDNGRSATQGCFDQHILEFVEDVSYQMPKDENYPERGYYYGGAAFNNEEFVMRFKLPSTLLGEKVLLQWFYYTANSCSPDGYYEYFEIQNDFLPENFWGGTYLPTCTEEQFPKQFFTGDSPERFVNCAEVTIIQDDDNHNNHVVVDDEGNIGTNAPVLEVVAGDSSSPTYAPVVAPTNPNEEMSTSDDDDDQDAGVSCCSMDYKTCDVTWSCNDGKAICEENSIGCPNLKWLSNGPLLNDSCAARWDSCTSNNNSCCDGLVCKFINEWYSQCLHPTDPI